MPRLRLAPTHPSFSTPCTRTDTQAARRKLLPKLPKLYDAKILYEDRGLVALDKPAGLITQSSGSEKEALPGKEVKVGMFDRLLNGERTSGVEADVLKSDGVLARKDVKRKLSLSEMPSQVHRLDKLTTGIFLLAKSKLHARNTILAFRQRKIEKTYLALVRAGKGSFKEKTGVIDVPLVTNDGWTRIWDKKTDQGLEDVKVRDAVTKWEVLGTSDKAPLTLLKLNPTTGYKHQLRVHLAGVLKAPILGDTLSSTSNPSLDIRELIPWGYTVSPKVKGKEDLKSIGGPRERMFLHATSVQLTRYRPRGNYAPGSVPVTIYAPLPPEFVYVCEKAGLLTCLPKPYVTGGLVVGGKRIQSEEVVEGLGAKWLGDEVEEGDEWEKWGVKTDGESVELGIAAEETNEKGAKTAYHN